MEPVTITFKLKPEFAQQLDRAVQQTGGNLSINLLARQYVIDRLESKDANLLLDEIRALRKDQAQVLQTLTTLLQGQPPKDASPDLHQALRELRKDFANGIAMLLLNAGKVRNPQQARQWVLDNLMR
jgi:hypothetical protein